MIEAILTYLINNYPTLQWVRFGGDCIPSPPYGVIKPEKGVNGRNIRVILHNVAGSQAILENDLRSVVVLLNNYFITDDSGNHNALGQLIDYTDVGPVSDDNTISMEALFLMPTHSF
jgi:hypothetical protein